MWNLPHGPLHADMYAYTMALAHFRKGDHDTPTTYHAFVRKNPFGGSYTLVAGIHDFLRWLRDFRFTDYRTDYLASLKTMKGNRLFDDAFLKMVAETPLSLTIDALPEGELTFPNVPFARVSGPQWQCLIVEATLLNLINAQSLVATEASRCVHAAEGTPVIDGSLRRSMDVGGYASARAAYIGGFSGTSNVAVARALGLPARGTFAHAYVTFHKEEETAFRNYAETMDDVVMLLDTYDTLTAARLATRICKEIGKPLLGVRLDSGDLGWLSLEVRRILDEAGFRDTYVMASNDLNPRTIASLRAQQKAGEAAIDRWMVGTDIGAPHEGGALGGVYKLAEVAGRPVIKVAERGVSAADTKTTIPGPYGVVRMLRDKDGRERIAGDTLLSLDTLGRVTGWGGTDKLTGPDNGRFQLTSDLVSVNLADPERPTKFRTGQLCYVPHRRMMTRGDIVYEMPSLDEIQAFARTGLDRLDPAHRRLDQPHIYVAGLDEGLYEMRRRMIRDIHLSHQ
ncbi:nicotinate phosphoribosyltransferase [Prosthecodimorpha staleyi]|uniref:Nicotinate phosphoribosyltransferase n=1 Tax=Prosthecodimorpha staleyi TaxID=2840188 RepID=A0A947D987_9HYPH|nr:nicotinate phosphoribosyltransferase [Prosthecodimorpha staleyi]MBT9292763.1 nicotinate phosphoribosyltransferase [Prosthecodimorpha staleyi]